MFLKKNKRVNIIFYKINPKAKVPSKQTKGAGCFDIYTFLEVPVTLQPKERYLIPTGIKIQIPQGYIFSIRPRSGLSFRFGITLVNSPGTIDSDYRGEIFLPVINLGEKNFTINSGDRIAQGLLEMIVPSVWIEAKTSNSFGKTLRGKRGFGHTGI